MSDKGILYLVATPIGNLEDITLRAIKVLKQVDIIAAEDTRQTIKLLNHLEIKKPLVSYYEHNKISKGNYLIEQLLEGKEIALVSDAGTPAISDPGEDLVKLAIENGIQITSIPGPVAAIAGITASGLQCGRFVFEGFLPMNKKVRKDRLSQLKGEIRTIVFYEAPHKLIYTLKDLYEILGDRRIVLARELTKRFEEYLRFSLKEALDFYTEKAPKGEFVLMVEGASEEEIEEERTCKWSNITLGEHIKIYLDEGMTKKESISKVAADRGLSKRDVYNSYMKK
ncbi:16S rRNA (cytidine(1402)-2'-O)-methyltransferase [Pseudobacteroides cellulosolvens]|uniref:Ribosomal RNA small subunit methyltransferase I n=1 Tax=Pseudobacteroides cellulosolvens ATCC 35603 = DSM 2933 TaxID=398512 RepID=A0A0L6JMW5_9FIRM|nr:16S rRNA (cytidine(1402)-2'-O)-methyltransferase [Pseudobacteroides cellulosolvens]KNY27156.1 Ribosomal RNA small subunit methyltransferase I [Pseudobacteroides cellulosolvens ATCC 35603 = DSM 2933]